MAFDFEQLPLNAKRAAFAAMDRGKTGGGKTAAAKTGGTPSSGGKAGPASMGDRAAAAYKKLAKNPGESWVGIIDLRKEMSDADRGELDQALKEASRSGRAVIVPESNRKVLNDADHAAAIRIGGEDNHLIMFRNEPAAKTSSSAAASSGAKTAEQRVGTLIRGRATSPTLNPAPGGGFQQGGPISREAAAEMMFGTRGAATRIAKANARRRKSK